jgi:hypothetical protein
MRIKYYIIQSRKNVRGVWASEDDLAEIIENEFSGHAGVITTQITERHYMNLINGNNGF